MPRARRANIGRRTRHANQQQVYSTKKNLSEERQNIIRENARLRHRVSTRRSLAPYNRFAFQYDPTVNYSDDHNLDIGPMTTADQETSNEEPASLETMKIKVEPVAESESSLLCSEKDEKTPADEFEVSVKIETETNGVENVVKFETDDTYDINLVNTESKTNNDEGAGAPSEEWQQREQALLKRIEELEKIKTERSEDGLRLELKVREEEIDLLRSRVKNLETELQAALSKPAGKNQEIIQNIKQQHEELLSKARGMIFDKTKMVKNQELQIEALNSQVQSLKDINTITKDLLNIRNSEVKAMEDRLEAMEARYKAEKERHALVLQRAQTSSGLNDDLKKEYETQLAIFKELRVKYEQRVQALVSENQQLKDLRKMTTPS